jgi:serine/threonine-protein kinase
MPELLQRRYELGRQIGAGGMATVYEGRDTALGRKVAVKVMHRQLAEDASFVARFDGEARAIAALNHPGIVSVYDAGRDGDRYFIVMEFAEGESVKQMVSRGPLSVDTTIDVGLQIAKALEYAHGAGILHQDVKSQNILVSADGAAKLVDFGIATMGGADTSTGGDAVMGTVHYIAPERARGEQATAASDIYSLGIVLYEMATGRLPFEGTDLAGVARQQVSSEPIPPSRWNSTIPPSLERTILRALQKSPAARQASAGELARELVLPDTADEQSTAFVPVSTGVAPRRSAPARRAEPTPRLASVEGSSSTWPLVLLALLALILVVGLIPLWSAVLQGFRG